ncbi:hypothetical protein [Sphingomonas sp.]|jgi:hypothetical protein|uniref:hypothetical protein n=1 Tax=Sphingomonas sp. TaxID=28214 RepID=UPI002E356F06|nr:hypothetical protein [Sphingomonas sp.]HEX4694964.1 hypothetical protein [Sphingomonas sp.]
MQRLSITAVAALVVLTQSAPVMASTKTPVNPPPPPSIDRWDTDHNGALDPGEFSNWGADHGMNPLQTGAWFQALDGNQDGMVTPQEMVDNAPMV